MARKKCTSKSKAPAAAKKDVTLRLDGDLTIRDVVARRDAWRALIDSASAMVVDAGAVERIDSAGLQLLVALRATAARRGIECRLERPSAVLVDAAATVGLGSALGVDAAGSK